VADKPKPETPKQPLSDEIAQRIRAQIIHGGTGYGQPSKERQFKKGQSGNPRGRPRGSPPDLSIADQPSLGFARQIANKTIPVQDGGNAREVSRHEVLISKIFTHGVKGNARYAGMMLDLIRTAEQAHAREVRAQNEYWADYKSVAREAIAELRAKGEAEPAILPHPDDIVIDWETGPRFVGPVDEAGKAGVQKTIAHREAYLLQAALDERMMPQPEDGDLRKGPGTALEFAKMMNRALPPRLRMTEFRMYYDVDYYARHPMRWLLKAVYASWRKLGKRRKRGELFPPLGEGLTFLSLLITFSEGVLDGTLDRSSEKQIAELIIENRRFAQQQGWI
jgi:hypothetical protein